MPHRTAHISRFLFFMEASHHASGDDIECAGDGAEDGLGSQHPHVPAKAVETACHTEEQRATLERAMGTMIGAVYARGFDIQFILGHEMPEGCAPGHPATQLPLSEFKNTERCAQAAIMREVVLVGIVPKGGPRPGTPAKAHGLEAGTQTAVVCMNTGDVRQVRDAIRSMRTNWPRAHTVILITFCVLTPYTAKEIANIRTPRVQHFNIIEHLQHRVLEHKLVRPHIVLDAEQKYRAIAKYMASPEDGKGETRFVALPATDPPVRMLGLEPGDFVHVTEEWGRTAPHDTIFIVMAA